jgi:hypothetical protein
MDVIAYDANAHYSLRITRIGGMFRIKQAVGGHIAETLEGVYTTVHAAKQAILKYFTPVAPKVIKLKLKKIRYVRYKRSRRPALIYKTKGRPTLPYQLRKTPRLHWKRH